MKGMTLEAVTQAVGGVYTGPESRKNTELTAIRKGRTVCGDQGCARGRQYIYPGGI